MAVNVRKNGPYAPLGANYADDDAITTLDVAEDDRTELLYLRALAYCARDPRTEGYVSDIALKAGRILRRSSVRRVGDSVMTSAERLADLGLWTREGDGYRITSWLKWNKSWEEISLVRQHDADRKRGKGSPDSDPPPTGIRPEAERSPSGVVPPRHGTALHGTSRHATVPGAVATMDGNRLLSEHCDLLKSQPPRDVKRKLGEKIDELVNEGIAVERIRAGLAVMRNKPHMGPALLGTAVSEADNRRGPAMSQDATGRPCPPGQEHLEPFERYRQVNL